MQCNLDFASLQFQYAVIQHTVSVLERCFNNGQSWIRGNLYPNAVVPGSFAHPVTCPNVFPPPLIMSFRPLVPTPTRFLTHMLLAAAFGTAAAVQITPSSTLTTCNGPSRSKHAHSENVDSGWVNFVTWLISLSVRRAHLLKMA